MFSRPLTLPGPVALVRLAMLVACLWAIATTQADPDLWGHIRFGGDIVAARGIDRVDSYSFTSDRPVIDHEWLGEVLMFGAYTRAGALGLVALKLAIVVGLLALVWRQLRVVPTIVRDRLVAMLILASLLRLIPVRPQLFSLLLFGVLLALLVEADRGRFRALAAAPLVMAAWANLHGGWIVGLGILGLWTAGTILSPRVAWRTRVLVALAGVASGAATLVNAYGLDLWRFLHETVGVQRTDISDWQPIYRLSSFGIATWLVVAGTAVWTIARLGRHIPLKYTAIVAFLGAMSWRVSRLDAFFAIAFVMLLGPFLTAAVLASKTTKSRHGAVPGRRVAAGMLMAAVVALVVVSVAFERRARCIELNRSFLPEPEAADFVLANHLSGRMITFFDWGEYAIWHLSPAIRVSMDGRREVAYTDATVQQNHRFFFQEANAGVGYADTVRADYVWTPNVMPVADRLARAGWPRIFHGPVSSIFARVADGRLYVPAAPAQASACFPGP